MLGFQALQLPVGSSKILGIFVGFFAGSVSIVVSQVARRTRRRALWGLALLLSPFTGFLVFPVSIAAGGGFFLGGATGSLLAIGIERVTRACNIVSRKDF